MRDPPSVNEKALRSRTVCCETRMAKSISLPEPGHRQEIEPSHANEDLKLILMTLETIKIMKP